VRSSSLEYFTIIDDFFRPYYSLLPNYVPDDPHCHPRAVLATNWQNDRLAGCGSYMNFKVSDEPRTPDAEVKLEEDIRALRWGWPEQFSVLLECSEICNGASAKGKASRHLKDLFK
jgi:hypothetical protein